MPATRQEIDLDRAPGGGHLRREGPGPLENRRIDLLGLGNQGDSVHPIATIPRREESASRCCAR